MRAPKRAIITPDHLRDMCIRGRQNRLTANSIRASGPTGRRANGVVPSSALASPAANLSGDFAPDFIASLPRLSMVAWWRRVGPLEIAVVGGAGVGDDVGVVGAGDQDRDAQPERRDLAGHATPPTAPARPWPPNSGAVPAVPAPRLRWRPPRSGLGLPPACRAAAPWSAPPARTRCVANILSHKLIGVSSTIPAAEMPALCTSAYGAPTASSIDLGGGGDRG